jgi:adenylate cyclase
VNEGSSKRFLILGAISLILSAIFFQFASTLRLFTDIETYTSNWRLAHGRWCDFDTNQFEYVGIDQSRYDGDFFQVLALAETNGVESLTADQQWMHLMASRNYPWSRALWGEFIEKCMSQGAKAVVMDIVFATPGEGDAEFAAALEKYRTNVVVGSMFEDSEDSAMLLPPALTIVPPDEWGDNSMDPRVGLVNIYKEADGKFKRGVYRYTTWNNLQRLFPPEVADTFGDTGKDGVFDSLAARAATILGYGDKLPAPAEAPFIRWTGAPEQRFKMVSLRRFFDPGPWKTQFVDPQRLKGKVVLIGPYANFFHDEHETPFGMMKGPEVHLNMINAAIHGEFIKETFWEANQLIVLGAGVITILMTLLLRRYILRFFLGVALSVGYGYFVVWMYNYHSLMIGSVAVPIMLVNLNNIIAMAIQAFWQWLDKRDFEANMGRYFSPAVMDEVRGNPGSLDAKSAQVTLLLTDLRNSTPLAEKLGPKGMFTLLNQIFEAQTEAIMDELGNLEHFLGDQFLSYWGAPNDQPDGPNQALRSARQLIISMEVVKQKQIPEVKAIFGYGVALHSGFALVGNKGSEKKMEYGLVGDTINEAARIEALTKYYGARLLVSQEIFDQLNEPGRHRLIDRVIVKGKSEPVVLYELEQANSLAEFDGIANDFKIAFDEYSAGKFAEAKPRFQKLIDEFDDGPSKVMVDRCEQLIAKPRSDWKGVWKMESK